MIKTYIMRVVHNIMRTRNNLVVHVQYRVQLYLLAPSASQTQTLVLSSKKTNASLHCCCLKVAYSTFTVLQIVL